jgi:eukaryotic-like serine/threonine-protein kinase
MCPPKPPPSDRDAETADLHGSAHAGARREIDPLVMTTLSFDPGLQTRPSPRANDDVSPPKPELAGSPAEVRYSPADELLGAGGMGAVWTVDDKLVGRRVALKVMRSDAASAPEQRAMFLREARVQGQLEHPAIVPVYDIGFDATGAAYFTMKRVRGRTLSNIFAELRTGSARARIQYSPRRLLAALSSVCLAVDFAHRHGVVHRDLKPANIMLGEYGEVNVLDWGVCRVLADEPVGGAPDVAQVIGTPAYMSPEQRVGAAVGQTSDVFSLGAILFEALTLRRLIEVERTNELRAEGALTVELAAICTRATADNAADRYPSARALADEIEAYLDGERSMELRRQMASQHLADALVQLGLGSAPARRDALRSIGRALALEPEEPQALRALYSLLAEPPRETPAEVQAEIAAQQRVQQRLTARTSAAGYAGMLLFLPALLWIGVRSWPALVAFLGAAVVAAVVSWYAMRRGDSRGRHTLYVMAASTIAFALGSSMYGPLVLVPTMIATNTMALALHLDGRARRWAIAIGICGVVAPMVLAAISLLPAAYASSADGLLIRPFMLSLPLLPTLVFLSLGSAVAIFTGARSAGEVRDALAAAEREVLTQRWLLRQLLPERVA